MGVVGWLVGKNLRLKGNWNVRRTDSKTWPRHFKDDSDAGGSHASFCSDHRLGGFGFSSGYADQRSDFNFHSKNDRGRNRDGDRGSMDAGHYESIYRSTI